MNYQEVYNRLISKANQENRIKTKDHYYEAHHILPKCLGGAGSYSKNKQHPNIVLLTAKEHYIAHRLLCRIYPGNRLLIYAMWRMCNVQTKYRQHYKPSARVYQEVRLEVSNLNKNTTRPKEVREKISKTMTGRPAHNKGKKVSEEALAKWRRPQKSTQCPVCNKIGGSHAMKRYHFNNCGTAPIPIQQSVKCPHCPKVGPIGSMKRWHFNNCKLNKQKTK